VRLKNACPFLFGAPKKGWAFMEHNKMKQPPEKNSQKKELTEEELDQIQEDRDKEYQRRLELLAEGRAILEQSRNERTGMDDFQPFNPGLTEAEAGQVVNKWLDSMKQEKKDSEKENEVRRFNKNLKKLKNILINLILIPVVAIILFIAIKIMLLPSYEDLADKGEDMQLQEEKANQILLDAMKQADEELNMPEDLRIY